MKRFFGFNLIEIMISLCILGIVSAMAIPLYTSHMRKVYRLEAAVALSKLAVLMEEYYSLHNTYKGANLNDLGLSNPIAHHRYQLAIAHANQHRFYLEAIPLNDQAEKDIFCGTLSIDSFNQKHISGKGQLDECW